MPYTKSNAQPGKGVILSIGSTPVEVSELRSIKLSGRKNNTLDVTNFDSTAHEFVGSLPESGSFALTGNRVGGDTGQIAMETAFASAATTAFSIQLPKWGTQTTTGDKFTFNAIVEQLDYDFDPTKEISFSATLKLTGALTIVAGS